MEQKIYPLNVGQGDENKPLTPKKPKNDKKPSFGEWLKAKKWLVGAVATVVVIGGGVLLWPSLQGSLFKGEIGGIDDFPPTLEELYFGDASDPKTEFTIGTNLGASIKFHYKMDQDIEGISHYIMVGKTDEGGLTAVFQSEVPSDLQEGTMEWDFSVNSEFNPNNGNEIGEGTYVIFMYSTLGGEEHYYWDPSDPSVTLNVTSDNSATLNSLSVTPDKIENEGDEVSISYEVDHAIDSLFKMIFITLEGEDYTKSVFNTVTMSVDDFNSLAKAGTLSWDGKCNKESNCTVGEYVNGKYDISLGVIESPFLLLAGALPQFPGDPITVEVALPEPTPEICDNLQDDDLDGLIDTDDTVDCPTQPECNNTTDDDGDGKIDWPNDEGCFGPEDTTENSEGTTPDEICDNGADDDGDGDTDYDDSECDIPDDADIDVFDDGTSRTTFNPEINSVKLFYKLSEDAHVTIEIIDSDDEVVVELLDEDQDKKDGVSHYTLWWNGTKTNKNSGQIVPDGTYTYKITATHEDYPSLEDTEEGPITVSSDYVDGVGDFEDPDGGGVQPGDGAPDDKTPDQDDATIAMQNAQGGTTAGTGPGVLIYFLFPFIPYAFRRIKN